MKVPQYGYLSDESWPLRQRDHTPPWAPHMTELDATEPTEEQKRNPGGGFASEWLKQDALRKQLEAPKRTRDA